MLWLQSNEKFDVIAEFNTEQMQLKKMSKVELGNSAPTKTDGFFSEYATGWFALFKQEEKMYFVSNSSLFVLSDDTIVNVYGSPNHRILEVKQNGALIYSQEYSLDETATFKDDPTAFIEDEDFDFGLFVSNISKSPERKAIMLAA